MSEWRCEKCNKVKDLQGAHLKGKTSVRSDCWPCARKTTFKLVTSGAAAAPNIVDALANGVAKRGASPDIAATAAPAPFLFSTPPAAPKTESSSAPSPFQFQFGNGKTGNPFVSQAPSVAPASGSFGAFNTATSAPAASASVLMQPAVAKGPTPSPPFSFVAAPKGPAAAPPTVSLTPASVFPVQTSQPPVSGEQTWRCIICGKGKDLRGPHLANKTTVRSDCWPCAKKQTFVLYSADGKPLGAAKAVAAAPVSSAAHGTASPSQPMTKSPFVSAFATTSAAFSTASVSSATTAKSTLPPATPGEPASTTDTLWTSSSFENTPLDPSRRRFMSAFTWREPEVPGADQERSFFLSSIKHAMPNHSHPCHDDVSLSAAFYEKTLQAYLKNVRSQEFLRSLPMHWNDGRNVVYVVCSKFTSNLPPVASPLAAVQSSVGELASILVHLETIVPKMKRVFCSEVFTYAAAALYQGHVNSGIDVFGPARDKTIQPSLLDAVIDALGVQSRVTSGEQRNAAVKSLWTKHFICVTPSSAVAEVIRLAEPAQTDCTDVVLLPHNVSPADYAQFRLLIA